MFRSDKGTDDAANEPLTNGESAAKKSAEQNEMANQLNGDVISNMSEDTAGRDGEFRIIQHLVGVQVAPNSTTTLSVLSSETADKVLYLEIFKLTGIYILD